MNKSHTFKRYWWMLSIIGVALAVMVVGLPAMTTKGADHMDAPLASIDGRTDINDFYVFQSPENPSNTVFVTTVNPMAGDTNPDTFHPNAAYWVYIDGDIVDGKIDNVKDIKYRTTFSPPRKNGEQRVSFTGPGYGVRGKTGETIPLPNGGKLMAGKFDDPFFFDLLGLQDDFNFTGDDFFAGLNVNAIVFEVPNTELKSFVIGSWARTTVNGQQIDRMGRPLVNTLLIPDGLKDDYNLGKPRSDFSDWRDIVVNELVADGKDPSDASDVARNSFPDVLFSFLGTQTNYPNGRKLEDDVGNTALADLAIFNPNDGVDFNDVAFSSSFPYLTRVHQ